MKKFLSLLALTAICTGICFKFLSKPEFSDDSFAETPDSKLSLSFESPVTNLNYNNNIINFENMKAMWFTALDYPEILQSSTEEEFSAEISERFEKAKAMGINTLFVHVRSNGDAYYNSEIFENGLFCPQNMDFDPLEIMLSAAHSLGLSFHAWINPLRLQSTQQMEVLPDDNIIKEWYNTKKGKYVVYVNGKWYLNPAYEETRELICGGVAEIVENYDVDGIHIDDYFYPTTDTEFDAAAFSQSNSDDLTAWRLENCSSLIKSMYDTVHSTDKNILFGISPQGNIEKNYSEQYADVKKWASESGYCDYIVPQIYYGFENQTCPFKETLDNWAEITSCKDVKLIIGICTYKCGQYDEFAGSGANEWIENPTLPTAQIETALSCENTDGIAVYSYASTQNYSYDLFK